MTRATLSPISVYVHIVLLLLDMHVLLTLLLASLSTSGSAHDKILLGPIQHEGVEQIETGHQEHGV